MEAENPVGKIFLTPDNGRREIIGVVGNAPYGSLREGPQPIIYFVVRGESYVALYVRTRLDLGSVVKMVEREAEAMGHGTRIRDVTMLDTVIGDTLLRERLLAGIGGFFAFLGLLLAAVGLFGLLNYSVTRRTKEIGIRAALGARPTSLVILVLKDLLVLIVGGLAAGLACSFAAYDLRPVLVIRCSADRPSGDDHRGGGVSCCRADGWWIPSEACGGNRSYGRLAARIVFPSFGRAVSRLDSARDKLEFRPLEIDPWSRRGEQSWCASGVGDRSNMGLPYVREDLWLVQEFQSRRGSGLVDTRNAVLDRRRLPQSETAARRCPSRTAK